MTIDHLKFAPTSEVLPHLIEMADLTDQDRAEISKHAAALVRTIRDDAKPGLMEVFLAEYGLSTEEGVALMCLAEALLRVPDADTIDALIEDKIVPSNWGKHLGQSASSLVNASTWGLLLTGRVLDENRGLAAPLRGAIKRLGEPVIRAAVSRAMKEMGRQFVLGETIQTGMDRAKGMEAKGYTYSYDMLGEAAMTAKDADGYFDAYATAIKAISCACQSDDPRLNPGISVKLSALHPRYEELQADTCVPMLAERLLRLSQLAKAANMGLNIDAEEADRLSLSLDIIEQCLADPSLAGWDGFGVVVQAYGPRTSAVIDHLYALAARLDRKIMVRLVKGAYWDTEIKLAQVEGIDGFPVYTQKSVTDVSYIANARKLLGLTDRIYPQFATHNAHTVAAILHMADDIETFEFQRLHGMGEALHDIVLQQNATRCRIYAPVGAHRDLLAYLVRRLLENGANSSFVNQIVDLDVPAERVATCPFDEATDAVSIPTGTELFQPTRRNSKGFDVTHRPTRKTIRQERDRWATHQWNFGKDHAVTNPADATDTVGHIDFADSSTVERAAAAATPWEAPVKTRKTVLLAAADAYEANAAELFAILQREAGKSILDAVAELREAVDFLRYYANDAETRAATPIGTFTCISPWNFPLAIFTGQIAAALAAGNAVLAKPAEQTPIIAARAVEMLHDAGVPKPVLQLIQGRGDVGAALTSNAHVDGVAFTGSTQTAHAIRRSMADHLSPSAPLIAETGGLNAMIVDSTALPEAAVRDIVQSAFQSAGQRCSALRCLYVQEDIADSLIDMLKGAMIEMRVGNPWDFSTDVGPIIDAPAEAKIAGHVALAKAEGRLLFAIDAPSDAYVGPSLIAVDSIADLGEEIFGPVLHVARFAANDLDAVMDAINDTGYGLTFGLHSRIDTRVQHAVDRVNAGNIYVNRNQIGAIVGSQPFGGHGLSGTGPKAGGPSYLDRFITQSARSTDATWDTKADENSILKALQKSVHQDGGTRDLAGPTGESNRLSTMAVKPVLCLGPGAAATAQQIEDVKASGGHPVAAHGALDPAFLTQMPDVAAVVWWGAEKLAKSYAQALSLRGGAILPLVRGPVLASFTTVETHVCIDTTAAGGNAALMSEVSQT